MLCNVAPDDWVARKHPPLLPQADRAALVDAIRFVDYIAPRRRDDRRRCCGRSFRPRLREGRRLARPAARRGARHLRGARDRGRVSRHGSSTPPPPYSSRYARVGDRGGDGELTAATAARGRGAPRATGSRRSGSTSCSASSSGTRRSPTSRRSSRESRASGRAGRASRPRGQGGGDLPPLLRRRAPNRRRKLLADSPWLRIAASDDRCSGSSTRYREVETKLFYVDNWYTVPYPDADRAGRLAALAPRSRGRARRQAVLLLLATSTTRPGPFEYVRGSATGGRYGDLWPVGRGRDWYSAADELEAAVAPDDRLTMRGPAGTVVLCDTGGFHRGGFARTTAEDPLGRDVPAARAQGQVGTRRFGVDFEGGEGALSAAVRAALPTARPSAAERALVQLGGARLDRRRPSRGRAAARSARSRTTPYSRPRARSRRGSAAR